MKRIFIIILYGVYAIVFGEVFTRVFDPVAIVPRYVSSTEYGIRGNDPNRSYWHTSQEYNIEIRTNSQGIRSDREYSLEKPEDVYRIVLLGDSFGMGYEVSLEDSFASRLEYYFFEKTGQKCEVINLSTSGHGNAEELIVLKERGLSFDPDLVLLCWHRTDYEDNVRSSLYKLEESQLVQANSSYLPGVEIRKVLFSIPGYTFIAENSQLYNNLRERAATHVKSILVSLKSVSKKEEKPKKKEPKPKISTPNKNKWASPYEERLAIALIDEIKKTAELSGAKLAILDIPQRLSRTEFTSTIPSELNNRYPEGTIYSPIQDFAPYRGKKLYWEKGHYHFTPLACDIVGKGLAETISKLDNRMN